MIELRICFKNLKPCPFSIEEKANTAFVFMPFEEELREVYITGIKETLEDLGWTCNRSDEKFDAPEIICTICKNAQEASLILADLTGRNPNVFLEVGLAFGLEKYVVFLSQTPEDIPFDTRTFRTIIYDPHELPGLRKNVRALVKSIKIPSKFPKASLFERRCVETKRIKEVPTKPLMEIFIGSTYEGEEWLPANEENLAIMRCIPYVFRTALDKIVPRRAYFEFKSKSPEIFAKMDSDGFFHAVIPLLVEEEKYCLSWIVNDIAQALFFIVRVMKKKGVKTEQTLRIDLHGIRGIRVLPFFRYWSHREWAFSEGEDFVFYQKTFNPKEKWVVLFNLLCEIYKEICIDLGIVEIKDETVAQNVKNIVREMDTLRTTYTPAGLEALSLDEIFGESSNSVSPTVTKE